MTFEERAEFSYTRSRDRQLSELTSNVAILTSNVAKLVEVTNRDADAIRTLARIADVHDQRPRDLKQN